MAVGRVAAGRLAGTAHGIRDAIAMETLFQGYGVLVREVKRYPSSLVTCFYNHLITFRGRLPSLKASRRLTWASSSRNGVHLFENCRQQQEMTIVQLSRCDSKLPPTYDPSEEDSDVFCLKNVRPGEGKTRGHGATLRLREVWEELAGCLLDGESPQDGSEVLIACQQVYENCFRVDCHGTNIAALTCKNDECIASVATFRSAFRSGIHELLGRICVRGGLTIDQVRSNLLATEFDPPGLEWFQAALFENIATSDQIWQDTWSWSLNC